MLQADYNETEVEKHPRLDSTQCDYNETEVEKHPRLDSTQCDYNETEVEEHPRLDSTLLCSTVIAPLTCSSLPSQRTCLQMVHTE